VIFGEKLPGHKWHDKWKFCSKNMPLLYQNILRKHILL